MCNPNVPEGWIVLPVKEVEVVCLSTASEKGFMWFEV